MFKKIQPQLPEEQKLWEKFKSWNIILYLQASKYLWLYNNNIQPILLPPLQDSKFHAFDDKLEIYIDDLWMKWNLQPTQSMMRIVWQNNKDQLIYYFAILQICVLTKMSVSYLLGRTLILISLYIEHDTQTTMRDLITYSSSLSVLLIVQFVTEQHYFQNIHQVSVKIRFTLMGLLMRKLNSTTMSCIKEVGSGQFFNVISMDLNDIDSGLAGFIAVTGSVIVGTVGTLLLYSYFGISAFIGIIVLITINIIQIRTINLQASYKRLKSKAQDQRTKLTSEFLHNIRTLKMFASEKIYRDLIVEKRDEQDKYSRKILFIDAISMCLTGNISVFIALLTTIISYIHIFDGQLSVDKIFGSLWVLQLIKVWCLTYFYKARKFWVNAKILDKRLVELLQVQNLKTKDILKVKVKTQKRTKKGNIAIIDEESPCEMLQEVLENGPLIEFKNYYGMWTTQDKVKLNFGLKNINIRWEISGQLISVIGKIGSYKSCLLQAILSEIPYQQGDFKVIGSTAYVEQIPYIFAGTIKENILFGKDYNDDRYQWSLQASCLDSDLQQKSDSMQVGDKGSCLSGGQRARVSFARALYSNAQIVLIDDILAAVDTKVAYTIFHDGILGLKQQGKIVVLVTHHVQWAALSDRVIEMVDGSISCEAIGPTAIQQLLNRYDEDDKEDVTEKNAEDQLQISDAREKQNQVQDQEENLDDSPSNIKVYKRYILEAGGYQILIIVIFCYLVDATLNLIISKQFGQWAQESNGQSNFNHATYLQKMALIIFLFCISNFFKTNFLFQKSLTAISNMHRKLGTSIARAQVSYFDTTPMGSILARFTNDLNNIESMVLMDFHQVLKGCFDNVFVIIVVSMQNIGIMSFSFAVLLFMFMVKKYFAKYMKYSVKCDDMTRGKLYDHVEQQIQGAILVRTYGQQDRFYEDFLILVYKNMQANFTFLRLNALCSFIFECSLTILVIFSLQVMILFGVSRGADDNDIGFSLLMLFSLGFMFSLNIRGQINLNIDMENAHRVFKSIDNIHEGEYEYDDDFQIQLNKWPQQGAIQFKNVTLNYLRTAPTIGQRNYALKNISFSVTPGQSLGVVGRTGAGKSSLLSALLRLIVVDSGSIVIDGIDIDTIGLHTLRENLLVIPQHAPLMSVSIKKNIDPQDKYQEVSIWDSLKKVGLDQKVRELSSQLETIAAEETFSAGEKQLLCLSRVLLNKNPKIILFDEATANMDYETDNYVQQTMKQQFPSVTKIIIAHRLQTVVDCDKVLVMDRGQISEFDTPFSLLTDNKYHVFRQMFDALDEVQKKEISQKIKDQQKNNI